MWRTSNSKRPSSGSSTVTKVGVLLTSLQLYVYAASTRASSSGLSASKIGLSSYGDGVTDLFSFAFSSSVKLEFVPLVPFFLPVVEKLLLIFVI